MIILRLEETVIEAAKEIEVGGVGATRLCHCRAETIDGLRQARLFPPLINCAVAQKACAVDAIGVPFFVFAA